MHQIIFFFKYLKYKLTAKYRMGYSVHSPFLYNLIRNILYKNTNYYALDEIADLRYNLLLRCDNILITDLGSGSKVMKSNIRKIKHIAKYSAISEKFGEMLFRLIEQYKPHTILELGTSLGIGTLYLAMPSRKAEVYTIEGCSETAKIASENFKDLNVENINQIIGNIDEKLPDLLNEIHKLDFVYFDGNHRKDATLNYYYQCILKAHNDTIFYIDDIHWSKGMEEAWAKIKADPKVSLTIDLFFSGIVFFKKELSKQDFIVRF